VVVGTGGGLSASFTVSPNPGTKGQPISFNGTDSTGPIVSYAYDFGDGSSITDPGPNETHTYVLAGTYTVRLTVRDSAGKTATTIKTVTIS
jgi:PKD repeat protein